MGSRCADEHDDPFIEWQIQLPPRRVPIQSVGPELALVARVGDEDTAKLPLQHGVGDEQPIGSRQKVLGVARPCLLERMLQILRGFARWVVQGIAVVEKAQFVVVDVDD